MKCHNCERETGREEVCPHCGKPAYTVPLIGKLALKYKTVSREQLNKSIAIQNKYPKKIPLEEIWIRKKFAHKDQVDLLLMIKDYMNLQELDIEFIKIALNEGFINNTQLEDAKIKQFNQFRSYKKVRIIGEILVEDKAISLEDCNHILSVQKRALITKEDNSVKDKQSMDLSGDDFPTIRKLDEQFAKIAVKNSIVSRENVLKALKKQVEEFRGQSRIFLVGEILYGKGLINYRHVEIILKKQGRFDEVNGLRDRYLNKITKKEDEKSGDNNLFELVISENRMEAHIIRRSQCKTLPSLEDIKKLLVENKIRFGIVGKDPINNFLSGKIRDNFLIARGKRGSSTKPAKIEFHFDTDLFIRKKSDSNYDSAKFEEDRKSILVKKGTVLATKIPMEGPSKGINVFGEEVDPEDKNLFPGYGVKLSSSGLEIIAERTGEARLSLDGSVHVLSKTNLLEDADVRSGPFEFDNFIVSGTVTDAFPMNGGDLKAEEIRDAKLDMIGDIEVDIGITGARIKTQGSVKARYIHNSQIEAFGDVVSELEILDSSILSSGTCRSLKSRIVSSSVSAKRGIFSKGVGTGSSIPCMLNVGVDDHIDNEIREINLKLVKIENKLSDLLESKETLMKKESELKTEFSNRAKNVAILDELVKKLEIAMDDFKRNKEKKLLRETSVKKSKAFAKLRMEKEQKNIVSGDYKEIVEKMNSAFSEYKSFKRESEKLVKSLNQKKKAYLEWKEKTKAFKVLKIEGEMVSGTTICGPNSSVTTRDDYNNVKIAEVMNPKDPSKWDLGVEINGSFNKLK